MSRILIVEDSRTQAEEMTLLLEDAGFLVERAGDGLAALRSIRQAPPDLVVSDLQMPGMDGLDLVDAIRHDFPFVPVVLVTAFGSENVASRALRDGAASYVPKRDLLRDLVPTVKDVLALSMSKDHQREVLRCLVEVESRFILGNDHELITPLVRHLEESLSMIRFCDPTGLIRVGVALREILSNAIEHGNLELDSSLRQREDRAYWQLGDRRRQESPYRERRVHVTARVSPSLATFIVRDEGPGFNPSSLPDPSDPAQLGRLSGRGLLLIRAFMDEVRHNERGNEITVVKYGTRVDESGRIDQEKARREARAPGEESRDR